MVYKDVKSSLEISKSIQFYLEMLDHKKYDGNNQVGTIRNINDIFHGRNTDGNTLEMLINELKQNGGNYGKEIEMLCKDIDDFLVQKATMQYLYIKPSTKEYKFSMYGTEPNRLKIINQRIFDDAVKNGFPYDFFHKSYFDNVKIYCLPDNASCTFSYFNNCSFKVCRAYGARFTNSTFVSTDFQDVFLSSAFFTNAKLYNTHFRDCDLSITSFYNASLKKCNITYCNMQAVNAERTCTAF